MSAKISRKEFIAGMGGTAIGLPLGMWSQRSFFSEPSPPGARSFAQCGEDIVVAWILLQLEIPQRTYLDIGAHDPVLRNNTYLFYLMGGRGVLVEPNVALFKKLRTVRPGDTVLSAGIGVASEEEADYYLMTEPTWNTFSKEEAEHQQKITNGKVVIEDVIKMPLININEVMATYFTEAPSFVSIDAEGLHQAILTSIDFARFRPKVICVETLVSGTNETIPEIPKFMDSQGYVDRGGSFVNTIFVDGDIL